MTPDQMLREDPIGFADDLRVQGAKQEQALEELLTMAIKLSRENSIPLANVVPMIIAQLPDMCDRAMGRLPRLKLIELRDTQQAAQEAVHAER